GKDERHLAIDQVGIKDIRFPVAFADHDGVAQATIAQCNVYVALPEDRKGTHMSRMVMLLEERFAPGASPLSVAGMRALLDDLVLRLNVTGGRIELRFPYFVRKIAPISGVASLLDYEVALTGELADGQFAQTVAVAVPVTSLCPCSKEISAYGAHNQRSRVTITVRPTDPVTIHELLRIAEEEASCELYGILKRSDEKYVTERAYDNPRFVEDLVRGVASRLGSDPRFKGYCVEAENFESIHNHSAYARIAQGV
ncbi:MAG: GTP cyclohydrolase FolE2, partial [Betaproteobacteria bacterium]